MTSGRKNVGGASARAPPTVPGVLWVGCKQGIPESQNVSTKTRPLCVPSSRKIKTHRKPLEFTGSHIRTETDTPFNNLF